MFFNLWKLEVPKEKLVQIIDLMDADEDGFVSLGEAKALHKKYAKHLRNSARSFVKER